MIPVLGVLAYFHPPRAPFTVLLAPLLFINLAITFPVVEEWVFRGLLQERLYRASWGQHAFLGISVANIITSAVFALVHLWNHPPLAALSTFFPSLVFGFFRDRYGTVLPSMWLHGVYNATYFLIWTPTSVPIT